MSYLSVYRPTILTLFDRDLFPPRMFDHVSMYADNCKLQYCFPLFCPSLKFFVRLFSSYGWHFRPHVRLR